MGGYVKPRTITKHKKWTLGFFQTYDLPQTIDRLKRT